MPQKKKKAGGGRISKVKRNNQVRNKLVKQGKLKLGRTKSKSSTKPVSRHQIETHHEEQEENDDGSELLDMVEEEDLEFLKSALANRSYSLYNKITVKQPSKRKSKSRIEEPKEIEELYEDSVPPEVQNNKSMRALLPIKTKYGLIKREILEEVKEEPLSDDYTAFDKTETKKESDADEFDDDNMDVEFDDTQDNGSFTAVELLARREEVLRKKKFMIGVVSSGILENPEEKIKNMKYLFEMMDEKNIEVQLTVKVLSAISVLEIFKDIIPDYQIKHFEKEGTMLKKETLVLQGYEKNLINFYKLYLQKLEKMLNTIVRKKGNTYVPQKEEIKLAETAFSCLCDLLVAHPYFNFWKNLVQLLVPFLNHKMPNVRQKCAQSVKHIFLNDKRGEITLEIVRKINLLVKKKCHSVHKEVLEVLLSLRLKEVNLDKEKEDEIKQKKFMTHKQKLLYLSKRERKKSKKLDQLEKELLETKAEESKQFKMKHLTETTKSLFTIYFRILKTAPRSKVLSLTLEGLAKYAHCINIDFYHDLVNVLDGLMTVDEENSCMLSYREQLHCVLTVFTILSGPGIAINIDPLRFYSHLYRNLLQVTAGQSHGDFLLVISSLDAILIRRRKKVSLQRQVAFTKRLGTVALNVLHNGALACLKFIKLLIQLNKAVDVLLDTESTIGGGIYLPELDEPEYCNASNTALWELHFLTRHYHPTVKKIANHVLKGAPTSGEGALPPELSKLSPEQLFKEFDPAKMVFKPAIPLPKQQSKNSKCPKGMILKNVHLQNKLEESLKDVMKNGADADIDYYSCLVKKKKQKTIEQSF